jgi:Uma2 family endonuclease
MNLQSKTTSEPARGREANCPAWSLLERFKAIEANLEEIQEVRLSYFAGVLEIMSPIGDKHETVKSTISVLLEAYMRDAGIRHYRGGFTLEASGYASGTPDESYSIGKRRAVPDIVIEAIITSGSIDRKSFTNSASS